MAEALQRDWSLPVLKVSLVASGPVPEVRIRLLTHQQGEPSLEGEWSHLVSDFGSLSSGRGRGPELTLPKTAVDRISEWVHNRLGARGELWLHLVKPYAFLGGLDWEGQLQPSLGIPLLRLPDVFPIPEIHRKVVDVAICASGPAVKGPPPALATVPLIAQAFDGLSKEVRLHVFADQAAEGIDNLSHLGAEVRFHQPSEVFEAPADLWPDVNNPWLRWMLAARGEATDVVHFVGHGYYASDQGWLALADAPVGSRQGASHIGSTELAAFLTSMGAATVGFSTPPDNYSPAGLRVLVDALGAGRAGPVMLHDPQSDPEGNQLGAVYAFLLGERGRRPPLNPSLMFYCQPERIRRKPVRGINPVEPESLIDDLGATAAVQDYFSGQGESQPRWVAVAERFIDQQRANLLRERTSSENPREELALNPYSEGVEQAIRAIRDIVERHTPTTTVAESDL